MNLEYIVQLSSNLWNNPKLLQINPYVRLAKYDILPPNHRIEERIIYDYELLYVKSGTAEITIENNSFLVTSGDICLFRPKQRHSIYVTADKQFIQPHVHFDLYYDSKTSTDVPISFKAYDKMTETERQWIRPDDLIKLFPDVPSMMKLSNPMVFEQILFDLIAIYQASVNYLAEMRLRSQFYKLLEQLMDEVQWKNVAKLSYKQERVRSIRMYLDKNTEHHVTLDELSQVYHIDKSYISRLFKAFYGVSPINYHLQKRIEKAKILLRCTNISINSIADQTGFSCLQDFSRCFKRIEGVSPTNFRNEM